MKKTFLSMALILCMLLAVLPLTPITATAAEVTTVASGTCGATASDSVTWVLLSDGTLTIDGSGAVADYSSTDAPWKEYADNGLIKNIIVGKDVTFTSLGVDGKIIEFKDGDVLYAQEIVIVDGGKISEPAAPSKDGRTFLGWFTKNTSGRGYKKFDFANTAVAENLTLYAAWDGDFAVEVTQTYSETDGYYKTFEEGFNDARGETPTFKLLKNASAGDITSSSRAPTIDLNGKTLTCNIRISEASSAMPRMLAVCDSSADKDGTLDGTVAAAEANTTLNVRSGKVNNVVVGNGGTVNCGGGKITNLTVNDGGTVNHTGGTATCTDKAKCEVCGQFYGEVKHADLAHVAAKAATTEADGNIEYWHCAHCSKYFSDENCRNEIALADTVIAKLGDSETPATGDGSHMTFGFVLLFVSGGALVGTALCGQKKKYSAK